MDDILLNNSSFEDIPLPKLGIYQEDLYTDDFLNLSFEDLIKTENLPVKITSGYRGKGGFRNGLTKSGKVSNHNRLDSKGNPLAYDIQPFFNGKVDKSIEGFNKLLNIIYSNPRVVAWLKYNNKGILEEITPEIMKKSGATGPHLHVGPDSWAKNMTKKRYQAITGLMLDDYYG